MRRSSLNDPRSNDKVLIRHRGGSSIMTEEVEIGMLQAPEAGRGKDWIFIPEPWEGAESCCYLDFRFLASRTEKEDISETSEFF